MDRCFAELPQPPFYRNWVKLYLGQWENIAALQALGDEPVDIAVLSNAVAEQLRPRRLHDVGAVWRQLTMGRKNRLPPPESCPDLLDHEGMTWDDGHTEQGSPGSGHLPSAQSKLMRSSTANLLHGCSLGYTILLFYHGATSLAKALGNDPNRTIARIDPDSGVLEYWTGKRWQTEPGRELPCFDSYIAACEWCDEASGLAFYDADRTAQEILAYLHEGKALDGRTRRILIASPDQRQRSRSTYCHIAAQYIVSEDNVHRLNNKPELVENVPFLAWPPQLAEFGPLYEERIDWRELVAEPA